MQKKPSTARPAASRKSPRADFPYAIKSFLGYLEGTEKALHTIKNYRLDLLSFHAFLTKESAPNLVHLEQVGPKEVARFHDWLKEQGKRNNTRRRKLLTVQSFLKYLSNRHKVTEVAARKFPTPHKIERIPSTVNWSDLVCAIRELPSDTLLDARNRALLWTLAETGCQVSEVSRLKYSNWSSKEDHAALHFLGKAERTVSVSLALYQAIQELQNQQKSAKEDSFIFLGFNRHGPLLGKEGLGSPISPRGVELLVRSYEPRLQLAELTPRTFRHSVVLHWLNNGIEKQEVQRRLGLTTDYAFRTYDLMLKAERAS